MTTKNLYLQVDYREKDLYLLLEKVLEKKYSDINLEISKENLQIGDFVILDSNKNILFIFERKTLQDLLSSVKDGRYENQSKRLLQCNINPHNVIYLIEGNLSLPGIDEKEKNLILSCIISLNNYKGFSVIRTLNKLESSEYLSRLLYRLNKKIIQNEKNNVIDFNNNETNNEESNELNNFHISSLKKLKKNKDITRDNINICFLCQIPGISEKVAFSIINHYDIKKFDELILKIREDEESLNNIKIETNGKFRKINKNIIDNIKYYLI